MVCAETLSCWAPREREASGGRRFKNTYQESPEQFLTSFHFTGVTTLYWELLLHGKMISCGR